MQRPRILPFLLLSLAVAACGGGSPESPDATVEPDAANIPVFRNPIPTASDEAIAIGALQIMGADVDGADVRCEVCHGMTRARLHGWQSLSDTAMSNCLTDLEVTDSASARAMIACMRTDPTDESSPFSPAHLGLYATAVNLPWWGYLFELAYPGEGAARQQELIDWAGMPQNAAPLSQAQFDMIAEWVARGMPLVDTLVPEDPIGACTPGIGPEVAAHVTAMQTGGWAAVNASNGINMLGCAGAATPRDCLATFQNAADTAYGANWENDLPGSVIRILAPMSYHSSFWTRSSADGRFVAHGGGSSAGGSSTIIDLANPGRLIGTAAAYDPGFFPDNRGFAFQGGGAEVCDQSLLSNQPFDNYVDYNEPECNTASSVGLYQHLGATPGGDYWIVNSQWVGDSGGWGPQDDPQPFFDNGADLRLTPLVHNGTSFDERPTIVLSTPYEGDSVLSPATGLVVSRVNNGGEQAGYRLRQVVATPDGAGSYDITTPVIATYCIDGAKPAISFDERWLVVHHYITADDAVELGYTSAADPGFAPYLNQGSANIYLVDMLTGVQTRVTRMGPGQFALFPHFRSDGWLYFNVRTGGGPEYIAASDAALLLAE